ncbi:anti-sigma factor domain-containing protein [Actimicrobium sp. CCI2.3]|uniref:anti-sigma factor n=1 Tax=Actimicrobium sp. CCI2.3 TaxID=3048616 RepID=UPI002AB58B23|nr:anti-sigma factor [Actimicrobium sp. CCI2.3]MDY7573497.1 anti-sigma factor [Actimicrobium sp. CCI2.3]MEB0022678.1 anti-sigma factor [Actimicrobium sp. CCI2.3]
MNIIDNEKLVERLSAEYVLGTLKGGARRRFEALLTDSLVLRRCVAQWQDRLHPMAELAPAAQPSPQVWTTLASRLQLATTDTGTRTDRMAFWRSLRNDLAFWRGLGLVSTALATVLVGMLLTKQVDQSMPATTYVAMLTDDKSMPVALATGDPLRREVTIKLVNRQDVAADKSLQLWAVPTTGAPRSLGLLAADGTITLPLAPGLTPEAIPLLAVSLEPKGGSPNPNGPTGPIIYKGAWVKI